MQGSFEKTETSIFFYMFLNHVFCVQSRKYKSNSYFEKKSQIFLIFMNHVFVNCALKGISVKLVLVYSF